MSNNENKMQRIPVLGDGKTTNIDNPDFRLLMTDTAQQIITAQQEVSTLISHYLASLPSGSENQDKLSQMLREGAKTSAFFQQQKRDLQSERMIVPAVPGAMDKFRNLMLRGKLQMETFLESHGVNNVVYKFSHQAGMLVGRMENFAKPLSENQWYAKASEVLSNSCKNAGVFLHKVKGLPNGVQDIFFFMGERRVIKTIEKNFSSTLRLIGVDAKKLSNVNSMDNSGDTAEAKITVDEVARRVDQRLIDQYHIEKSAQGYQFKDLNQLDCQMAYDMIDKILWPRLKEEMSNNVQLNSLLKEALQQNAFMKNVVDFSRQNNIGQDVTMHALNINAGLLDQYKGAKELWKHRPQILEICDRYADALHNNQQALYTMIDVVEKLQEKIKSFNIDDSYKQSLIEKINQSVLLSVPRQEQEILPDGSKGAFKQVHNTYTFEIIRENMHFYKQTQNREAPGAVAQIEQQATQPEASIEEVSEVLPATTGATPSRPRFAPRRRV